MKSSTVNWIALVSLTFVFFTAARWVDTHSYWWEGANWFAVCVCACLYEYVGILRERERWTRGQS